MVTEDYKIAEQSVLNGKSQLFVKEAKNNRILLRLSKRAYDVICALSNLSGKTNSRISSEYFEVSCSVLLEIKEALERFKRDQKFEYTGKELGEIKRFVYFVMQGALKEELKNGCSEK